MSTTVGSLRDRVEAIVSGHQARWVHLADRIWEHAEVGLHEYRSARLQVEELEAHGFRVESGAGGMPTAFVATYRRGDGTPAIGFLGEYDALPGLSQARSPERRPLKEGAPGHGCGHNLLGTAAMGAAVAVRYLLEEFDLPGTVRYFGCPAEETLVGKVFMARDGCFDGLDACLTWHPASLNMVWDGPSLAMNSVKFRFRGRASHAAADPHHGRSALDAVELMNVGVNYLREHMPPDARIHYVITRGGAEPNVVPAEAEAWYYVRAPGRDETEELYQRVLDCAAGAALMTGTTFETEFLAACYNTLINHTLNEVLHRALEAVGPPAFDDTDHEFARRLSESVPPAQKAAALRAAKAPADLFDKVLHDRVDRPFDPGRIGHGSTDVGDVSWIVPTAQLGTACVPLGTPGHSWQFTAAAGSGIGHKGMLTAAKAMAVAGLELLTDTTLLEKARAEFLAATEGQGYRSPLPEGAKPPVHQLEPDG